MLWPATFVVINVLAVDFVWKCLVRANSRFFIKWRQFPSNEMATAEAYYAGLMRNDVLTSFWLTLLFTICSRKASIRQAPKELLQSICLIWVRFFWNYISEEQRELIKNWDRFCFVSAWCNEMSTRLSISATVPIAEWNPI